MREYQDRFRQAGVDIVVALCQKRESVRAWLEAHPQPFPVVVDEDRSNAKAWGVYVRLNFESLRIARPASFLVDGSGVVRFAFVSSIQWQRANLDEILAVANRRPRA